MYFKTERVKNNIFIQKWLHHIVPKEDKGVHPLLVVLMTSHLGIISTVALQTLPKCGICVQLTTGDYKEKTS